MIRQTDYVRVSMRCHAPTIYPLDDKKCYKVKGCEYLEDGKCTLNACIRLIDEGRKGTRHDR